MKRRGEQRDNEPQNLKRFKSVISQFNKDHSSDWATIQGTGGKREIKKFGESRKERRKQERKLKKKRKMAFCQRKPLPTKESLAKEKREVKKAEKLKKLKEKKNAKRKEKKKKMKQREAEKEEVYQQGLRKANEAEDKMIKQLEKQLKLKKKKGKGLPLGFANDGLDYLLEVIDTDRKPKSMDDEDSEEEDDLPKSSWDLEDDEEDEEVDDEESSDAEDDFPSDSQSDESSEEQRPTVQTIPESTVKDGILSKKTDSRKSSSKSVSFSLNSKDIEDLDDDSESISDDDVFSPVKQNEKQSKTLPDKNSKAKDVEKSKVDREISVFDSDDEHGFSSDPENDITLQSDDENSDIEDDNSTSKLKEDIYGRLRDDSGKIVRSNTTGAYVPPGRRQQLATAGQDGERQLLLERMRKQLKGLLNRLSESNLQSISTELETMYRSHSRMELTEILTSLILDACISTIPIPERLVMEHVLLVAVLHANIGMEVGAHILQTVVQRMDRLMSTDHYGPGKELDNTLVVLAYLYNFKVVKCTLIFDVLKNLADQFGERDVEMLLLLLKNVGVSLRKDDPASLRDVILLIQNKAATMDTSAVEDKSRVRFMLEVLLAIKNNNMRKIPNYDPSHMEHLRKVLRTCVHGASSADSELNVSLADLLSADTRGRWWIVGSAWSGQTGQQGQRDVTSPAASQGEVSAQILQLAKQQRMNTDIRKNIFCAIMTSEDFVDAFEKLLHMGLKPQQEREIIHVILDLCVQEKSYNPFYAFLAQKFAEYDRRFLMTVQFSLWDKFKVLDELGENKISNLSRFLCHLLSTKALSLSVFKVIEFGELNKTKVRFMKKVLSGILLEQPLHIVTDVFSRIAPIKKLHVLREGLKLFMRHFLLRDKKSISEETKAILKERVEVAEKALSSREERMVL